MGGEGEASVLRQNADANTIFIHSGEQIANFSMHDLTIDYNHQSQSSPKEGMYIGHASECLYFYNLWIRNCKKFGIHVASLNQPNDYPISCKNVKVENIIFSDVMAENWDLFVVASHGGYIRNVTILGMHRNCGIVAFEGSNLLITDCYVTIDCQDGEIVGGIWLGSCNYSLCANNTVIGQTMYGDYETIGIRVNTEHDNMMPRDSYKNMVTNNNVSTIRYGIMLEETMDDYVAFNTLTDCANGIAFPDYGYPVAVEPKIFFNALFNVANYIQEFMAPVNMLKYWNGDPTSYVP
ncbi:MAG: NosD domain-containing protein [Candidatus Bathyarchaeia archaeon]